MNYFDPYPLRPEQDIVAAWASQVAEAEKSPWLAQVVARAGSEFFPRFAACYTELRALPRSARRALQRRIAGSSELAAILPQYLQQGGRRLQHRMAWSLAGAALLLALGQGIPEAATITVTTNKANTRRDNKCSLIEAIDNANNDAATHTDCVAGSGADTIVLPADATFTLKRVNNKTHGPAALPVITSPITIQGNGAKIVRSDKRLIKPFRHLAVSDTGELTLQDVTLSGGSPITRRLSRNGGAILNHGTLLIQNSTISGNTVSGAVSGGGGVSNFGTLTIENSTISGNSAGSFGGGISNFGTVTIENSIISDNHAGGIGGGIFNEGALAVVGSTISDNSARQGGGAFNNWFYFPATLSITNSIISGNEATDDGGGIFNRGSGCFFYCYFGGDLSLVDSTITQNQAGDCGGGLFNEGTLSMTNSVISNNQAPVGPDICR
jgi:hypothetical protein